MNHKKVTDWHQVTTGLFLLLLTPLIAVAQQGNPLATPVSSTGEVPVSLFPAGVFLRQSNDPQSVLWQRIPVWQIELEPAPPVHPSVMLRWRADAPRTTLFFQVASDGERLYFRFRWRDPTADRATTLDRFRDGVAVQFALQVQGTSHMMGSPQQPVNIWYWRAGTDRGEDLAAGGPGSTTRLAEQHLSAASVYTHNAAAEHNQWIVVLSRPLNTEGPWHVPLAQLESVPVNFAVWQGAEQQRDGHKNAGSGWTTINLKPLREKG